MNGKKSITYPEALKKLANYCAYQERCHQEVEKKLNEFFLIPEAKEKIITYLLQENYLNETRFAQSFSRGKFKFKQWGRNRITQELKQRKISPYNIKKGLQEIESLNYRDTFENLAQKKWDSLTNETQQKAKQKFISYFQYRGWENELIFNFLNKIR